MTIIILDDFDGHENKNDDDDGDGNDDIEFEDDLERQ
jgi:hypothetical protein